jgi:PAS domain S-box-containing protein
LAPLVDTQSLRLTVGKAWRNLTEPSSTIHDVEQRRQAQFLSIVLVVFIPTLFLITVGWFFAQVNSQVELNVGLAAILFALVITVVAYFLSRTQHYKWSSYIMAFGASAGVIWTIFGTGQVDQEAVYYLFIPLLMSSLLLNMRMTLVLFVVQLIAVWVIATIEVPADSTAVFLSSVRFQTLSLILVLAGTHFRNLMAADRAAALKANEDLLVQTNDELESKIEERTAAYRKIAAQLVELIAEREQFESTLSEERNLLRTVIDNLPDHIFAVDAQGKYTLSNQAHSVFLGYSSSAELTGRTLEERLPESMAQHYWEEEQRIMDEDQPHFDLEQQHGAQNGETHYYSVSKIPLHDATDKVIGLVGIGRDITERKRQQTILEDANSQLEQRVQERTLELSATNALLRDQIREREQAEEQLQYQANVLENVSDAVISTDENFRIRSWNRAAETIYGYRAEDIIGKRLPDVTGLLTIGASLTEIITQVTQVGSWTGETTDKDSDGSMMQMLTSIASLRDRDNTHTGLVFVSRDITERKRIEAAEREQRLLAEALRDTSAAINSTLNLPEILDRILEYIERVLPYDSASIMLIEGGQVARVVHGTGFNERGMSLDVVRTIGLIVPDHWNLRYMSETAQPLLIADTNMVEGWHQSEYTTWIHSYAGAPIQIEGKVIGFVNLDSAEKHHFQLADAEKLQAFADQAGLAIHNANLFDAIAQYADELEQRVAQRTAELVRERAQIEAIMNSMNDGVFGVVLEDRPRKYANAAFQRMVGYSSEEWSFERMKPVGDEYGAFATSIDTIYDILAEETLWQGEGPIRRKDGTEFHALVTICRIDNLEGKPIGTVSIIRDISQEKELEQQQKLFVANASHELRTPITNMITRLYLTRKKPELLNEHLDVLDLITKRMRGLVEDLLDHSRFERGVIPLEPKAVDLRDVVNEVVKLQTPEAERKQITLELRVPETALTGHVDPERMIQVITNLTINAIHYTPEGGQVFITASQLERTIQISVRDTGIGVPAALLPNLFKPFYRVSEKTKGTGLGLSIARGIIRAHDGDITVESQPNVGSTFIVTLPTSMP